MLQQFPKFRILISQLFLLTLVFANYETTEIVVPQDIDQDDEMVTIEPLSFSRDNLESETMTEYKWNDLRNFTLRNKLEHKIGRRSVYNAEEYEGKFMGLLEKPLGSKESVHKWIEEVLLWHNKLRALHGVPDLQLDYKLAYEAQLWATKNAELSDEAGQIVLKHVSTHSQGENLGGTRRPKEMLKNLPGKYAVKVWYGEIKNHNWDRNTYQHSSGHFTQVIWEGSKRLGCGEMISSQTVREANHLVIACRYVPPGNNIDPRAFKANVKPPLNGDPNQIPNFADL